MKMDIQKTKYIKSGEFTFCSRCGKNVVPGPRDYMCESCMNSLFGRKVTPESGLKMRYESTVSEITRKYREDLADARAAEWS